VKPWLLFFLGTLAYFLYIYINRSSKDKPSLSFWISDNWPELLFTFLFDLAAILILLDPETQIDVTKIEWFPAWLILPVKLVGSFLLGYGGGYAIYNLLKRKVRYETDKKIPQSP
jgi:hypothetical protein